MILKVPATNTLHMEVISFKQRDTHTMSLVTACFAIDLKMMTCKQGKRKCFRCQSCHIHISYEGTEKHPFSLHQRRLSLCLTLVGIQDLQGSLERAVFHLPVTKAGRADKMGRLLFAITAGRRFLQAQNPIKCPDSGHVTPLEPLFRSAYLLAQEQASTNTCTGVCICLNKALWNTLKQSVALLRGKKPHQDHVTLVKTLQGRVS